jgi:hypothetical protein
MVFLRGNNSREKREEVAQSAAAHFQTTAHTTTNGSARVVLLSCWATFLPADHETVTSIIGPTSLRPFAGLVVADMNTPLHGFVTTTTTYPKRCRTRRTRVPSTLSDKTIRKMVDADHSFPSRFGPRGCASFLLLFEPVVDLHDDVVPAPQRRRRIRERTVNGSRDVTAFDHCPMWLDLTVFVSAPVTVRTARRPRHVRRY